MKPRISKILTISIVAIAVAALSCGTCISLRYSAFWRYAKDTGLSPTEAVDLYGWPTGDLDWMMSLSNAAADEDWDRLDELTRKDHKSPIGSYYRNLAKAMKGELGESLMGCYAPFERALFIPVAEKTSRFGIENSGEVWYQLGDLTMAEHSAIVGLIGSRNQNGRRFLQRLGEINHIWGDETAAAKYFAITGRGSSLSEEQLARRRSLLPRRDTIHHATSYRESLKALVEANPGNRPAYEYLVCLDLLLKDLDSFAQDFNPGMPVCRIYQEAGLIWMSVNKDYSQKTAAHFRIEQNVLDEFGQFSSMVDNNELKQLQKRFGHTYWFYFKYAARNEKE